MLATDPSATTRPPDPRRERRRSWAVWVLPIGCVVVMIVMTIGRISGSSVGAVTGDYDSAPGLLAGTARTIRSDEWLIRTPLVLSQIENGFPTTLEVGVGEHHAAVLSDLPTAEWSVVFRPHLWAYFVLPAEYAFAFEWWSFAVILIGGIYALLLVGTRSVKWAAIGAMTVYASPFIHWWYVGGTLTPIGYCCGGIAALLVANRETSPRGRFMAVGLASYLIACFALQLYPPFQIPIALAVGFFGIGVEWGRTEVWTRERVARLILNVGIVGAVSVIALAAFVVTRWESLSAIAGTVYPGQRRIVGGDGSFDQLSSPWFGWTYRTHPEDLRGKVFINESEAAGFFPLGLFLLAALPFVGKQLANRATDARRPMIAVAAAALLLSIHMFVGLPAPLAILSGLNRVQPVRAMIGLGLAATFALVVVGMSVERSRISPRRRAAVGAVLALLSGGSALTLALNLRSVQTPLGAAELVAPVLIAAIAAASLLWNPVATATALVGFGAVVSLTVNPLQQGLGVLADHEVSRAMMRADAEHPDGHDGWVATGDVLQPLATAAGVRNLSGVNLYPDGDTWGQLDPDDDDEEVWNRYARTVWLLTNGATKPQLRLLTFDVIAVEVDPCSPALDDLEVGHIASTTRIESPCTTEVAETTMPTGEPAYIYDRDT